MIDYASFISAQNLTYENGSYWLPEIEVNSTNKLTKVYTILQWSKLHFLYYERSDNL